MLNQTRDALLQEVREYRASHGLRFDVDEPFYARATGERIYPTGNRAREDAQDAFVMARELTALSAENQLVWLGEPILSIFMILTYTNESTERVRRLGARRDFFIRGQWIRFTDRAQTAAETRAGGDRVRAIGDVLIGPIDRRRRLMFPFDLLALVLCKLTSSSSRTAGKRSCTRCSAGSGREQYGEQHA